MDTDSLHASWVVMSDLEKNFAVAEDVMGFELVRDNGDLYYSPSEDGMSCNLIEDIFNGTFHHNWLKSGEINGTSIACKLPDFLSDPEAMLMIMDRIRPKDKDAWTPVMKILTSKDLGWQVQVENVEDGSLLSFAISKSLLEAVSEAAWIAVKMVGVKEEDTTKAETEENS